MAKTSKKKASKKTASKKKVTKKVAVAKTEQTVKDAKPVPIAEQSAKQKFLKAREAFKNAQMTEFNKRFGRD